MKLKVAKSVLQTWVKPDAAHFSCKFTPHPRGMLSVCSTVLCIPKVKATPTCTYLDVATFLSAYTNHVPRAIIIGCCAGPPRNNTILTSNKCQGRCALGICDREARIKVSGEATGGNTVIFFNNSDGSSSTCHGGHCICTSVARPQCRETQNAMIQWCMTHSKCVKTIM